MLILNSLPIMLNSLFLYKPQISVTITCGIQPTGAVTMAMCQVKLNET